MRQGSRRSVEPAPTSPRTRGIKEDDHDVRNLTLTFGLPLGHLAPVAPVHVASEFTVGVSFFQGSRLEKKIVDPLMFKFPILWFNFNSTLLYSHCSIFSFLLSKDAALTQPFYAVTAFLKEALASEDATLPGLGPCLFLRLTVARKRIANAAPSSLFGIAGLQLISSNCTTRATPNRASVVERSAGSAQTPSRTRETRFRTGPRSS